jgi:DNA-directed RNA polymerase subunit L|tara:strand:+ start:561 stop:1766 length:1206 start_codon:yes stop_codon:yes gene_type:complete
MSFSDLKQVENNISFQVNDIDVSILNSIRRIILSEIPNVAFEFEPYNIEDQKVKIIENTCPLHNEFIQQRLSMIPINLSVNEILNFNEDEYIFKLLKKNNTNNIIDVTTEDIEIYNSDDKKYDINFTRKIFPEKVITKDPIMKDFILITKLKPNLINNKNGDKIQIEMKASKNIAKNYSGFGYVSQCVYYNIVNVILADKELNKRIKELSNLKLNKSELDEEKKNLTDNFNNLDRDRFYYKNDYDEPNKFNYIIESECNVSPKYLFYKALEIIHTKIENLFTKIVENKIQFKLIENNNNMYQLFIDNEKHTLGNLIQSLIFNKYIRNDNKKIISYIGYYCQHPLDDNMFIKIKLTNDNDNINKIFKEALLYIQEEIKEIIQIWIEFSDLNKNNYDDINKFI